MWIVKSYWWRDLKMWNALRPYSVKHLTAISVIFFYGGSRLTNFLVLPSYKSRNRSLVTAKLSHGDSNAYQRLLNCPRFNNVFNAIHLFFQISNLLRFGSSKILSLLQQLIVLVHGHRSIPHPMTRGKSAITWGKQRESTDLIDFIRLANVGLGSAPSDTAQIRRKSES